MYLLQCFVLFFSFLAANGNDTKKFKGDVRSPGVPSRVVHVRKLPSDINEAEVIALGLPFGKVTNLLMLKGKNQVGTGSCCTKPVYLVFLGEISLQALKETSAF